MLITYQQLARENVWENVAEFMDEHPTFMFLDESHRIKRGLDGKTASVVLNLSHLPSAKLIMTGTPLPNSVGDLVPQLSFLYPEARIDEANVTELIQPLYVRTTLAELNLPDPIRTIRQMSMNPEQRHLYELMRTEAVRQGERFLASPDRTALRSLGRHVMKLLQVVSNPALLSSELNLPTSNVLSNALKEGDSPKIAFACKRARELARLGKKSIIWSGFVGNVELLSQRLSDLGADYIHGGVDAGSEEDENTRERKIKRFHDDSRAFVLVANPAAASESISLHTVCHNAIYVDRSYNAAQYLQSEHRIHRIGLPLGAVTEVEILECENSIDQNVDRRLRMKVDKMASILNDRSLQIDAELVDIDSDDFSPDDAQAVLSDLKSA